MTRRIAVISAGLSQPSSTRLLADRLADAGRSALSVRGQQVEVEVIELRPLAHEITNAMLTGFAAGPLTAALDTLAAADGLIAVSPVFQASYAGLFKSFVDVATIGRPELLRGTPTLLGATAGTTRHSLVLESAMRPLFSYLGALTVPTAVFAAAEDWGSAGSSRPTASTRTPAQGEDELSIRIGRAAAEFADLVGGRPARPDSPTRSTDTFGEGVDFAALLGR